MSSDEGLGDTVNVHSAEYNQGYGDGYDSAIRDAQIEVRDALKDLQGARPMVIEGYDTEVPK